MDNSCVCTCLSAVFCVFMVGFTYFYFFSVFCSSEFPHPISSVFPSTSLLFSSCTSVLPHHLTPVPCLVRLIPSFTSAYTTPLYLSNKNLWSMMHWISHIWAHCFMILHASLCARWVSLLYRQNLFCEKFYSFLWAACFEPAFLASNPPSMTKPLDGF